ncbi:contact-dependent growth inhibition system immunity protein [Nocardioides sp. DS6]|uniref:Contact-dependent growth inhibition system immunity protein n=1 Tax=Nocardioides eburneus TaxID=3231482 RepID=A0ABV3SYY8_9ACTN
MNLPNLTQFLGAYLHQDWDLEYRDATDGAIDFARHDDADCVRMAISEIESLLAAELSEEQLQDWLLGAGCYYLPGEPVREWLRTLREVMTEEVARRA